MSRHRNVRSMNYEDEYDGYDDVYGHSVEDDYCVSPSTAQQFMYDRTNRNPLASFMSKSERIPEQRESEEEEETQDSLQDSSTFQQPQLSDLENAQLNSCLENLRSILGESAPDHILVDAVIKANFDQEKALNSVLNVVEAPKPQREAKARRNRGSLGKDPPAATKEVLPPAEPFAAGSEAVINNLSQNVAARMTFSNAKPVQTGFASSAADQAVVEKTNKAVNTARPSFTIGDDASGPGKVERSTQDDFAKDDGKLAEAAAFATPKKETESLTATASTSSLSALLIPKSASKSNLAKLAKLDMKKEYEKRKAEGKEYLNLVVVGHVDAGKSTLMGHVLYQLGFVNKRVMHKYEQESKKLGKASFAYAWVLDETEEERTRGVTMDVAQTRFQTASKIVTLLDAPGHKDFIPNMITGAAQADVAVLVVNATRGEFETGFEMGGQTREHAMLIRSLGVSQLIVAVNKMDTVDWSEDRFQEIVKKLRQFLKHAGFRDNDIAYVPCSGLNGENLVETPTEPNLVAWYSGPCVVDQIDKLKPPERPTDKPFRLCVADIFKGMGSGVSVSGTIQAGSVQMGDKVLVMPQGEMAIVKSVVIDDLSSLCAFAGDNIVLTLLSIEINNLSIGSVLCDASCPIRSTTKFKARIVLFNIEFPVTKGYPVVLHYQSMTQPAIIRKLISQLHKSTGEVVKNKPRCLTKNSNAVVEIEVSRPICIELYKEFKDLGRFMMRFNGSTIAAGLVIEIMESGSSKGD